VCGVGPVTAARVLGEVSDVARFGSRHHFVSYNGTAPIDKESGRPCPPRVNTKGNRRLNHAIHIVAVTQIRAKSSSGHAYYQRKLAENKTEKEAMRALKRKISDAIHRQLVDDATLEHGPGRASGDDSNDQRDRLNPDGRLFGEATARTPRRNYASTRLCLTEGCHSALATTRMSL
jgi:transposase